MRNASLFLTCQY